MMKNTEPLDAGAGCGLAPAPDARQLARQRAELESRQAGGRRQQLREALRSADMLLAEASLPDAPEPRIGLEAPADERIIGSGDRMHHLALVAASAPPPPPRPAPLRGRVRGGSDSLVLPPGPMSRAECRRRCGKGGFCDPSAALGCGGEYCGNATAAAREAL